MSLSVNMAGMVEASSPARPVCAAFGRCGGCLWLDRSEEWVAATKEARVRTALARQTLQPDRVAKIVTVPANDRRRASLTAIGAAGGGLAFGFQAYRSHDLVELPLEAAEKGGCQVLAPPLKALLARLQPTLRGWLRPGERGSLNLTLGTHDMVELGLGRDRPLAAGERSELTARLTGDTADNRAPRLVRLWERGLGEGRAAVPVAGAPLPVTLGPGAGPEGEPLTVALPPGGFLQASPVGQAWLQANVTAGLAALTGRKALANKGIVADLFAGVGTFALPLAMNGWKVAAYEIGAAAVAALAAAAGARGLTAGGRLQARMRDLQRRPLTDEELGMFDALVLDPPRRGAPEQMQMLTRLAAARTGRRPREGGLPPVIYVSCDPDSFARDAARLVASGGWTIERVLPLDQFRWSAHVELVAWLAPRQPGGRG